MCLMPAARSLPVVVVPQHVGQRQRAIDDELGVAIEQAEETPLARHETRDEVHCFLPTARLRFRRGV